MLAGYAAVILLLAGGMVFSIFRLNALSTAQVSQIRGEEREITIATSLRWRGEEIVSLGRGYIISADPRLLAELRQTEASFDRTVAALRAGTLTPQGQKLVTEAEQTAARFRQAQEAVLDARRQAPDDGDLVRAFEMEMIPRRLALAQSLERLVAHKEDVIRNVYAQTAATRNEIKTTMYGLLAMLLVAGLGVSWYFARLVMRSYRAEHHARMIAAQAVTARDEVMGIVAHDLRNPLAAITMNAGLVRRRATSDTVRERAVAIEKVSARMDDLIEQMLDVATMEAGRFAVTLSPCDVDGLSRDILEMYSELAASRGIRLVRSGEQDGLTILADRGRILQVLSNLVGNALKFTPEGGQVTISHQLQGECVKFSVADTGPGLEPEHTSHVFDRFWKREANGQAGTGLGLFIAKNIVAAHGGDIWVEGKKGSGATFAFTIPAAPPMNLAAPETRPWTDRVYSRRGKDPEATKEEESARRQ